MVEKLKKLLNLFNQYEDADEPEQAKEILESIEFYINEVSADEFYTFLELQNAEISTLQHIVDRYETAIQRKENLLENMKNLYAKYMIKVKDEKHEGNLCSIKLRIVEDIDYDKYTIPTEYFKERVVVDIDKAHIREDLSKGIGIPGVTKNIRETISIYKRNKKNKED